MSKIRVSETASQLEDKNLRRSQGTPAHWGDASASYFHNPWPSWRYVTVRDQFDLAMSLWKFPTPPKDINTQIISHKPTWGLDGNISGKSNKIKTTWLGHACFLVELPAPSPLASRGARILFDPVFSDRCSPFQFIGPKRFTPIPCEIDEIPEVDAVVISHNHYDHLDTHTICSLFKRSRPPHIFAPLGNAYYFKSLKIPTSHTHILDWWDAKRIEIDLPIAKGDDSGPSKTEERLAFDITCTPGQHFTGRGIHDRFKTLWASWVVEAIHTSSSSGNLSSESKGAKVYFAGDTGYRSVKDGQDEETVPTCPAFKEIGQKFGGFDLALIPIGAYLPRQFMSPIHCAPQDSVRLFKDIKAKKGLGMHWGTWVLTTEDVVEPPKRLAEECKKVGIADGDFVVCDIGETRFFDA